jgi:hypothetical protein
VTRDPGFGEGAALPGPGGTVIRDPGFCSPAAPPPVMIMGTTTTAVPEPKPDPPPGPGGSVMDDPVLITAGDAAGVTAGDAAGDAANVTAGAVVDGGGVPRVTPFAPIKLLSVRSAFREAALEAVCPESCSSTVIVTLPF